MDKEVLALLVRAKDEASESFGKIQRSLGRVEDQASKASKSLGAFGSVLQGIGVGIGVGIFNALQDVVGRLANAIPGLIDKGLQFTNLVDQLGDATGASAAETSRLIGTYQLLGISTDTVGTRMGLLARIVTSNETAINRYGIATRDSNGDLLNQVQIVENARAHLAQYESGTAKAAMMIKLFGRAGLDMADYLSLSDDQVKIISRDLEKMGVIMGSDTAEQAERAKIEMRRFDLSIQGLSNTLLSNILPVLIPAISGITNVIAANAKGIAAFMANVVNFVMGLVSALTGAKFTAVSFTDTLGEVGGAATQASSGLDNLATGTKKAGGASRAASDDLRKQIEYLDRMTESVKRLDDAQDARFQKEMDRLTGTVETQIKAIDAADQQRSIDEQRSSLLRDIAAAEAEVAAAADPEAQASAVQRLADIRARAAEFELDQADNLRKDQLEGVKTYIESIAAAEEAWASKKGLLGQLGKNEAILNSQIAAAQQTGDLQKVADLTVQLEAVKAAERRAQMALANEERIKEFDTQKTRLEELVKAAQAAGSGMGAGISAGAATAGTAIKDMTFLGEVDMRRLGSSVTGKGGLTEAMEDARLAGEKFGRDMKTAIDKVVGAIKGLIEWLDNLGKNPVFGFLTQPIGPPADFEKGYGLPNQIADEMIKGFNNLYGTDIPVDGPKGKALGGSVTAGSPYIVGERRPELFVPDRSGTILPSVPSGGTTNVTINVTGTTDPEATARAVMQAFQRERLRQGLSFG